MIREKKRYVLVEVLSFGEVEINEVLRSLKKEFLNFLGEKDFGKAKLRVIQATNKFVIFRVSHRFVDELKVCLSLMRDVNNKFINLAVIYVSGSLKKLRKVLKEKGWS